MNAEILKPLLDEGWFEQLKPFFESVEFDKIIDHLKDVKKQGKSVVPIDTEFLNAFKYCKYNDLKVVILAQDPYYTLHNGQPLANGLAFGSGVDNFIPASLRTIIDEVEDDVYKGLNLYTFLPDKPCEDLTLKQWAKQGVLLLNTALTVEVNNPGSHIELWRPFTNYVLSLLAARNTGLIYCLWGEKARKFDNFINHYTNNVLVAGHPSPLNTSDKKFIGCGHFSRINEILEKSNGKTSIIKW